MLPQEIEALKINNLSFKIIEVNVNKKINVEEWVKKHYSQLGFDINTLVNYVESPSWNILPRELIRIRFDELIGIPDFLVFQKTKDDKKIKEYFFVEVKTNDDGLTYSQLRWIKNHPDISILVLHIKQNIVKKR